jgi:hypothetical protein
MAERMGTMTVESLESLTVERWVEKMVLKTVD